MLPQSPVVTTNAESMTTADESRTQHSKSDAWTHRYVLTEPSTPGLSLAELVPLDAGAVNAFDATSDLADEDVSVDVIGGICDDDNMPLAKSSSSIDHHHNDDSNAAYTVFTLQMPPHHRRRMNMNNNNMDVVDDNAFLHVPHDERNNDNNDNTNDNSIDTDDNSNKQVVLLLFIK